MASKLSYQGFPWPEVPVQPQPGANDYYGLARSAMSLSAACREHALERADLGDDEGVEFWDRASHEWNEHAHFWFRQQAELEEDAIKALRYYSGGGRVRHDAITRDLALQDLFEQHGCTRECGKRAIHVALGRLG